MRKQPSARLLDVSRLVSRAGRVLTGIDRVELAYLRAVLDDPVPAFALSRTALGYVLLDQRGMARLIAHIEQDHWPQPDLISRLNAKLSPEARVGQTAVRSLAVARTIGRRLPDFLARHMPIGFSYLNVGHSNLTDRVLQAVEQQPHSQISVMVHDTIPLDYPQYQRPKTVDAFAARLALVSRFADLVICVTKAESLNVTRHLEKLGRVPEVLPVHIGVDLAAAGAVPTGLLDQPFFMTVGTIEPRKNHALLLDVWDALGADAPRLLICGPRGWENAAAFARLDRGNPRIIERSDLSDGALRGLMEATQGFVFPSFAEGFGLPPVEALAAGAPLLCADLPACHEIMGAKAVYLDPMDRYQWEKAVQTLTEAVRTNAKQAFHPPTWDAHFKIVFTKT